MHPASEQFEVSSTPLVSQPGSARSRQLRWALVLVAVLYAALAGLRTLTDYDLGWQMATGRWVVQHHQIPSVDVFSYTAAGHRGFIPSARE